VDFVVCTLAVGGKKSGQVSTCRIGPFPCELLGKMEELTLSMSERSYRRQKMFNSEENHNLKYSPNTSITNVIKSRVEHAVRTGRPEMRTKFWPDYLKVEAILKTWISIMPKLT
jgi:hypothetical protein